jgi:hypothetical protein
MASKCWTIAVLFPILMANAAAQEKNELTGIVDVLSSAIKE